MRFSRRVFLKAATALAVLTDSDGVVDAAPSTEPYYTHLGFQAYTVADLIEREPRNTLRRIANIGYTELELYEISKVATLAPIANDCGLRTVGCHLPSLFPEKHAWERWIQEGRPANPAGFDFDNILLIARRHGVQYLGYARVAPDEAWKSAESFGYFCELLNQVGARCRSVGIHFAYHNHFHEFASIGEQRYFDILIDRCHPAYVDFEVDVCWAAQGGQDPAALISRLKGRVPLIHLKDRKSDAPVSTGTSWPKGNIFAEVGSGTLDVPAILKAAHASGVSHVFVEQDETEGDPVDSLAKSFAFVRDHRL